MTDRIASGYRVIGQNTLDGSLHSWYFPTEEQANKFAEHLASKTDEEVEVCKFISYFCKKVPIEQVKSTD